MIHLLQLTIKPYNHNKQHSLHPEASNQDNHQLLHSSGHCFPIFFCRSGARFNAALELVPKIIPKSFLKNPSKITAKKFKI